MKLEVEWRIPWDADWTPTKKNAAAEKLAEYIRRGTMFETRNRMKVLDVQVKETSLHGATDPYLLFVLEN